MAAKAQKIVQFRTAHFKKLNDDLEEARSDAHGSRDRLYDALAKSYVWYSEAKRHPEYLDNLFANHQPPIKSKEGASEYNRTVKLIFGMTAPKHAPTVSKYATVLDYLDRVLDHPDHEDGRSEASYVCSMITNVGGIEDCIRKQREWASGNYDATEDHAKNEADFLLRIGEQIYKAKPGIGRADDVLRPSAEGFVILLGRSNGNGTVEVVDAISADEKQVGSYIAKNALRNTFEVDERINFFGNVFSLARAILGTPVATVSSDLGSLMITGDPTDMESLAIIATPTGDTLSGFESAAVLTAPNWAWLRANLADVRRRHLFTMSPIKNKVRSAKFTLTNNATSEATAVVFARTASPTVQEPRWQFDFSPDMVCVRKVYEEWLLGWAGSNKGKKPKQAIDLRIDANGITLKSSTSLERTYPADTDIKGQTNYHFALRGHELVGIFDRFWHMRSVATLRFRGDAGENFQIEGKDDAGTYCARMRVVEADQAGKKAKDSKRAKVAGR